MGAKLIFLVTLIFLLFLLLTKEENLGSEIVGTIDTTTNNANVNVLVTGIGLFDFVSRPLPEGPFKPRSNFSWESWQLSEEAEGVFSFLINSISGDEHEKQGYYTQKVVFDGFLAVINKDILAKVANVRECGAYSVEINRFFSGITIIYDCAPEM